MGTQGQPEAGGALDKTKAGLWAESVPRGEQGGCSVTNSVVKYRVKTYYKCLYLIFLDL